MVPVDQIHDHAEVVGIAERVGEEDGFRSRPDRALQLPGIGVVGAELDVDENGVIRFWMIGFNVVGNPAATHTTSSPGESRLSPNSSEVSAVRASRFALEPELTRRAYSVPTSSASDDSTDR